MSLVCVLHYTSQVFSVSVTNLCEVVCEEHDIITLIRLLQCSLKTISEAPVYVLFIMFGFSICTKKMCTVTWKGQRER